MRRLGDGAGLEGGVLVRRQADDVDARVYEKVRSLLGRLPGGLRDLVRDLDVEEEGRGKKKKKKRPAP